MANITINPAEVTELKTPIYKKDGNEVVKLLPETTADQIRFANGQNGETVLSGLQANITAAQTSAETAQNTASAANNKAEQALTAANTPPDLSAYATKTELQTGLAAKAGTSVATQSANGLMGSDDKTKLDGIEAGAQVNPTLAELGGISTSGGTITGNFFVLTECLLIKSLKDIWNTSVSGGANSIIYFVDKNNHDNGSIRVTHYTSGEKQLVFRVLNHEGASVDMGVAAGANGGSNYAYCPTPPASVNGNQIATASYVNQKLGSAASLTVLATLDEHDEAYVETLETRKLKAAAWLNVEAQQAIYSGFQYEIDGEEYIFGYSVFDQQNLADLAIMAVQNQAGMLDVPCRNEDGNNIWLKLPASEVLEIHKWAALRKFAILQDVNDKKQRIWSAENDEEIKAILME